MVAEVAGTAAATGAVTGVAAAVVVVVVVMKAVVVVVMVRGVAVVVVMMVDTCLMRSYFRRWIGGYERYAAHRGRVRVARRATTVGMVTAGKTAAVVVVVVWATEAGMEEVLIVMGVMVG